MVSEQLDDFIDVGDRRYRISEISEFGFVAPIELPEGETQSQGVLILGDIQLPVNFRVRKMIGDQSSCSFANLSIASSEKLRKVLKDRQRISSGNEELEARSYDELASGKISSQSSSVAASDADSGQKGYVKSFAMLMMLLAMVGLIILAGFFLRSRSSLAVTNAALVGNWMPINSKVEGEITEVLVAEGDHVRRGDLLLRLSNPEITQENSQLAAQQQTAQSKVKTLRKQKEAFKSKLAYASNKLELDRKVAMSEFEASRRACKSAQAALERLKPFLASGAVTQLEIDEVQNKFFEEESIMIAKENLVRQIDFSKEAAKSNILIIGDRIDDELGRIEADLEIAEAELREISQVLDLNRKNESALNVVAPRDGVVFVKYCQQGQFVKLADELMGLSHPGETWAAGQVSAGQASRVLPGQPVKIRIPSMKLTIDGTVMSVGHRAMYAKGNYNAEFRGTTATDVPIKVHIQSLPKDIPSGLRLQMAIGTGFGLEWLDDAMGYELRKIGNPRTIVTPVKNDTSILALATPETK